MKSILLPLIVLSILQIQVGTARAQTYTPEELIIDSIVCSGNQSTDCEIIQREIYLTPGQKINEEELRNATIRLQLLGLFRNVSISLEKGAERGHAIVNVNVEEANPYFSEISLSTYFQPRSSNNLFASIKIGNRNLLGFGKILEASAMAPALYDPESRWFKGEIAYIDPHLFGLKKVYLTAGILQYSFASDVSPRYFSNSDSISTIIKSSNRFTEFNFGLGYRVFDFSHFGLGIRRSQFRTTYQTFLSNKSVEEQSYEGDSNYLSFNYGWNTEDNIYFATEGSKFESTHGRKLTDGPLDRESSYTQFEGKKNFLISPKNVLSPSLAGYCFVFDEPGAICRESLNYAVGLEWGHDIRRNFFESPNSISDARFTLKPSLEYYLPSTRPIHKLDAGLIVQTKNWGLIKLNAYYWSKQ